MARITKDPQERMTEILDTAEEMFYANGYHETQITDIVKKIGVAQGTFYYYFKSKEEILEALISRQMQGVANMVGQLVENKQLEPMRKLELMLELMFRTIRYKDGLLFEFLYNDKYLHLMDKLVNKGRQLLEPSLTRVIAEGKEQGIFFVSHPEIAQAFIGSIMETVFEATYEKVSAAIYAHYLETASVLIEKVLGLADNSLTLMQDE
jgi:AcrR family transcriptional regulator